MPMPAAQPFFHDPKRIAAAAVAAGIELALALALIAGLAASGVTPSPSAIVAAVWTAPEPPKREPPPPPAPRHHEKSGKAAPPARRAEAAAPIYAPAHPYARPITPAAPVPAQGSALKGGAAPFDGPGSGAGGVGTGTGSGGDGDGAGDGGTDSELIGGRIRDNDIPKALRDRRFHGTTETEIAVGTDGRAAGCRVTASSGNRDLDALTCRLVLDRFRFRPARDRSGRPVTDSVDFEQTWDVSGRFENDPEDGG